MSRNTAKTTLHVSLLLVLHLWVGGVHAAVYHISPQTERRQAASIIKGLSPGDTLFVKPGDYHPLGIVRIYHKHATKHQPIKIIAENANTRVQGFQLVDVQWMTIRGFTIEGSKALPHGWQDMPKQVVDDPGVRIDPATRWKLERKSKVEQKYASWMSILSWENQSTEGIALQSSEHVTVEGNDVSYHTTGIMLLEQSDHIEIANNHLHHCLDAIAGAVGNGSSFTFSHIHHNRVEQIYREAIRLSYGAHDNKVEHNQLTHSGHSHITTYQAGDANVIQNNTMQFGGYYTETMPAPGGSGISIHTTGKDTQVTGNTISYHYDQTGRDGNGVIIDYTPGGVVVANNVIYRVMGSGITSTHSQGVHIVHNTIVESGFHGASRVNGVGIRMSQPDDTDAIIANNILMNNRIGGIFFSGNISRQRYVDHNLIYSDHPAPVAANGTRKEQLFRSLADWQRAGYAANSRTVDPQFANAEQQNFHIPKLSAAAGWASPHHATAYDKDGIVRAAAPSVGAYEPSEVAAY